MSNKIHIVGQGGVQPGDVRNAETQVAQQWLMELERRVNELEKIISMMNVEKVGLLNVIVGMAARLEKITGQKFVELKTPEGQPIDLPDDVPVPTIVGMPQMMIPTPPPAPSVEETKNVLQANPDIRKVPGPELSTEAIPPRWNEVDEEEIDIDEEDTLEEDGLGGE